VTDGQVTEFNMPISPEERTEVLADFARTPDQQSVEQTAQPTVPIESDTEKEIRLADVAFAKLTPEEQEQTLRLFTRLVRVGGPEEGDKHTRLQVKLDDLDPSLAGWAMTLAGKDYQLLRTGGSLPAIEIASDTL